MENKRDILRMMEKNSILINLACERVQEVVQDMRELIEIKRLKKSEKKLIEILEYIDDLDLQFKNVKYNLELSYLS